MDAAPPASGAQPAAVTAYLRRAAGMTAPPWLHGEVARRMAARLPFIKARPQRVLDVWSFLGHGEALRAQCAGARFEAWEPTPALADRRAPAASWWQPARWFGPAPLGWSDDSPPPAGRADLVWSNMMLHWQADPLMHFQRWNTALAVDGFVMFSCFGPDTLRELRPLYRRLGWAAPAHDFIDMHDLGDAMVGAGFAEPVMDMERLTLNWADSAGLLAELRSLGGNAASGRFAGLRTPRWHRRLQQELADELGDAGGRLTLSFEIVYGHAFKPAPRLALTPESRVDAETLRLMARAGRRR